MASSSSPSFTDSGVQTLIKRRKLEEKHTTQAFIGSMFDGIGLFNALVEQTRAISELKYEDYRRLYRLYLAARKALTLLETERDDLEVALEPLPTNVETLATNVKTLPTNVERVLQSSNDNVKVWSQYFYENQSPTKVKGVKTLPSRTTERIGGMLHSVAKSWTRTIHD